MLINTSSGSIIDWSPYGLAWMAEGKKLRWKWNGSDEIYTSTKNANETIMWHGGGMSPSVPHVSGGPIQHHIWKLVTSLNHMLAWKGYIWRNPSSHNLHLKFKRNTTHFTQACVRLPYLLLVGPSY